jgi:hypothetical protein
MIPHLLFADGVIGIGIATTAVGGIAAAVARKR